MTTPKTLPLNKTLLTPRLLIRRLRESDVPDVTNAVNQYRKNFLPYLSWAKTPTTKEIQHERIAKAQLLHLAGQSYLFGGFDTHTGELLLELALHYHEDAPAYELGYWCIRPKKGYMTEAVTALMPIVFEQLTAQRISLKCMVHNKASQKIAEKLNFPHEGTLKNYCLDAEGSPQDFHVYAHTPESWEKFMNQQESTPV